MEDAAWLTRDASAKYMQVAVSTIDRWAREKKIKRHRITGTRSIRYRRADLDKLLISDAMEVSSERELIA